MRNRYLLLPAAILFGFSVASLTTVSATAQERWLAEADYGLMFHYEAFKFRCPL